MKKDRNLLLLNVIDRASGRLWVANPIIGINDFL